jgi:hypothetical protein
MVSPASAKNFRGDFESLVLLQDKFSAFLDGSIASFKEKNASAARIDNRNIDKMQFYLAQCPIYSTDPSSTSTTLHPGPLSALMQDITTPFPFNDTNFNLSQINFWANIHSQVTSSLHFDLYNNLLCVVTGQKTVRVLAPKATTFLRNVAPVYAESANHADDDLFNPIRKQELDTQLKDNHQQQQHQLFLEFILNPGDALFLPEGWWHQVSSTACTTAVNFWWNSNTTDIPRSETDNLHEKEEDLDEDIMGPYFERCRARRLVEKKKSALLINACLHAYQVYPLGKSTRESNADLDAPLKNEERDFMLQLKDSLELIEAQKLKNTPTVETVEMEEVMISATKSIEDRILALISIPVSCIRIVLALKREFPGTIAVLLMEVNSAKFWEALTTGLESSWLEQAGSDEQVLSAFYDELYSDVGCDRKVITSRMVRFKEEFAKEAYETLSPDDSTFFS